MPSGIGRFPHCDSSTFEIGALAWSNGRIVRMVNRPLAGRMLWHGITQASLDAATAEITNATTDLATQLQNLTTTQTGADTSARG